MKCSDLTVGRAGMWLLLSLATRWSIEFLIRVYEHYPDRMEFIRPRSLQPTGIRTDQQ
jgi:hypothetical protein